MPSPELNHQQSVLNLLQKFKGTDPLKQLIWGELNYDRVNQALSRRGWKSEVASLLADDPVLLASGADAFHVIYCRLSSDRLLIGDERPVVTKLLHEHPYALFVFSNSKQEHFHFLNVKYDDDVAKRRLFRRITVGPNERLRTASERIALLDLSEIGRSVLAVQQRHDEAFDVEPVTREFFSEYRRIFEEVEEAVSGFGRDTDRKRLYTQRLFNRMMFIAFIQKKGWLKFNGDADYLAALWRAHLKDNSISDKNFYRDRLKHLFFDGLNTTNEVNRIGINRGGFLKTLIGDVPYLNGGLFEDDEDDNDENIKVLDKSTGAILNGLFAKFNFTVTESTPLDVEVAVDPEMLGRIFEELVTGRHESGSYYTPKPIVSFMCREALKGYLKTSSAGESKDAIERFVEKHEPDDLRNAESVLDALRRVKVCDPACGSGAYLLGMLHELLDLRAALFQSRKLDSPSVYQRKLEIIQTNVYGVDIDPFAVNIARLRLWLSLAVDFEGAKPEPLPNLDYKVEVGDSLLGPNPSGGLEMGFRKPLIDEFLKAKDVFLRPHEGVKKGLREKVERLKADIASFSGHKPGQGFDYAVEFAEVFIADGGFDVVLANPPYLGFQGFMDKKDALKRLYKTATGKFDYYVPFVERGLQCLTRKGYLCYICPTNFTKRGYGKALRQILASATTIHTICDFEDNQVFASALNYTGIFVIQHDVPAASHQVSIRKRSLSSPEIVIEQTALTDSPWVFQSVDSRLLIESIRQRNPQVLGGLCLGISEGIVTGQNDVFLLTLDQVADHEIEDEIIRPCIRGREIGRFHTKTINEFVLYPYRLDDGRTRVLSESELKKYPHAWRYLTSRRKDLGGRGYFEASSKAWYELWCQRDMKQLSLKKIIVPELAESNRFNLASNSEYYGDTVCGITLKENVKEDIAFLLGLLNSKLIEFIFKKTTVPKANGFFIYKTMFLKDLPIARIDFANAEMKTLHNEIVKLVKETIALRKAGKDSTKPEDTIDSLVYRAYGLTEDEIAAVESSMLGTNLEN